MGKNTIRNHTRVMILQGAQNFNIWHITQKRNLRTHFLERAMRALTREVWKISISKFSKVLKFKLLTF